MMALKKPLKKEGGLFIPQAMLIGLAMYVLTSIPVIIWFSATTASRLEAIEAIKPAVNSLTDKMGKLESQYARLDGTNQALIMMIQEQLRRSSATGSHAKTIEDITFPKSD